MISVAEALQNLFDLTQVVDTEELPLAQAAGRVLRAEHRAQRTQPPFAASAMDGYAVQAADIHPGKQLRVIGESAAGHSFDGTVAQGKAVRIFTGAPVPHGADFVVIQEDVTRDGATITLGDAIGSNSNIRPAGGDFTQGECFAAPKRLAPADLALLAAMNLPTLTVSKRPQVALIATGDELVMPGETPAADQIIASNTFGIKALLEQAGATCRVLPIARDTEESLKLAFDLAQGADLIVTIGGASVGDHDLVAPVATAVGLERSFYKIRMRPGKPLMAGRMGSSMMVGLPGNPVSAMVCSHLFLVPVIHAMQGLAEQAQPRLQAPLGHDIAQNGPREHYMRGRLENGALHVADNQDSSLLSVLAASDVLVIRPPKDGPRNKGEILDYLPL